jgi:hypothetical protein
MSRQISFETFSESAAESATSFRPIGAPLAADLVELAALGAAVAQLDEEGCAPLQREVVAAWQPFTEEGHLDSSGRNHKRVGA